MSEDLNKCIELSDRIIEASRDYRYLLSRGYNQKTSLDIVSSRYLLSKLERSLLLRCVHRPEYIAELARKRVSSRDVHKSFLVIDLLNTLSTLVAVLSGECVYMCDDGFIRDLEGSKRVSIDNPLVSKGIDIIARSLSDLGPQKTIFVADKNVSYSLLISRVIVNKCLEKGLLCDYLLAEKADRSILDLSKESIIISSDYVILDKAERIFDLVNHIVGSGLIEREIKLINLSRVFKDF